MFLIQIKYKFFWLLYVIIYLFIFFRSRCSQKHFELHMASPLLPSLQSRSLRMWLLAIEREAHVLFVWRILRWGLMLHACLALTRFTEPAFLVGSAKAMSAPCVGFNCQVNTPRLEDRIAELCFLLLSKYWGWFQFHCKTVFSLYLIFNHDIFEGLLIVMY